MQVNQGRALPRRTVQGCAYIPGVGQLPSRTVQGCIGISGEQYGVVLVNRGYGSRRAEQFRAIHVYQG